jgi:hypothetical protein
MLGLYALAGVCRLVLTFQPREIGFGSGGYDICQIKTCTYVRRNFVEL